jgi:hypothetical protein
MVAVFSYLYELDASLEVIHYLLVALLNPPLDREVRLASRDEQPERPVTPLRVFHLGEPFFFL